MSRVSTAATIIRGLPKVSSLLDVGCRDGVLSRYLPRQIDYFGADLVRAGDHVHYIGDFMEMEFDRKFDVVTAIDILEHVDQLQGAFDKLVSIAGRCLIVSLPNCYDLKSRYKFAVQGRLGGKYELSSEAVTDRHRWLMNFSEIITFYQSKAESHDLELRVHPVYYGSDRSVTLSSTLGRAVSATLPASLTAHSVIGEFNVPHR